MAHGKNHDAKRAPLVVGVGEILWDMLPSGRQLGGAPTNVAWHAACLGARSAIVSAVGDDLAGHAILERLDDMNIDRRQVAIDRNHPTGIARVALDSAGESTFVIDEGVAWDHIPLHSSLIQHADEADSVSIGTLGQRCDTSRRTIQTFLSALRPDCLRVFDVNLRHDYFNPLLILRTIALSDVVKATEEEWSVIAPLLDVPAELTAGAVALRKRYDLRMVALTRGPAGSLLCHADGVDDHPGVPCQVVDTVGAGDAFTAALTVGLLRNLPIPALHDFASHCAAFVCSQGGATPKLPVAIGERFFPSSSHGGAR